MTSKKIKPGEEKDVSVEQKLVALYSLQQIDAQIDKIRIIRGELPLEVNDLEDEIAGLETRITKFNEEIEALQNSITEKDSAIAESNTLIKK
jgi:predicted  nucleic acid-binding Zn-ribbon protein